MNTFDFKFHNLTIRAVEIEGDPWFVAKDVCAAISVSNSRRATKALPESEKRVQQVNANRGHPPTLINESGLYKLVMRSDKPEAKEFQHWVTSVVLPAIRKDGGYECHTGAEESAGGRFGIALGRTSGNLKRDLLGVPERS